MSVDDDAVCWLSARVVPGDGKCIQYRRSGSATCRECSAWVGKEPVSAVRGVSPIAVAVETLNSMEVVSMAAKKCSVPGCPKNAQGGCDGKCKSHFNGTPGRQAVYVKTADAVKPVSVHAKPTVIMCGGCGKDIVSCECPVGPCDTCGTFPCSCFDEDVTYNPVELDLRETPVTDDFGRVVIGESMPFCVDEILYLALEEAFISKRNKWLEELSGLKPGKAICVTAHMLSAIDGMGH